MPLLAWVKAAHLAASALIAGTCAFELLVLRRIASPALPASPALASVRAMLRGLALCGVAAGALTWLAWLALLAISMSGQAPADALTPSVLGTVVAQTTFGHVWLLRAVLLVVLAAMLFARARPAIASAAALLLVCSLAWSGHAVGTQPLHVLVDALHVLAASVWLGMLPPLGWIVVRACARREPSWTELATSCASRFSLPGTVCVAVLALTGLGNAAWLLDGPRDLVATDYGKVLLAKLAAFALMLVLAACNRWLLTPAARADAGATERARALRRLRASVLVETALGLAVLVAVGMLGVTPPGMHGAHVHHMEDM